MEKAKHSINTIYDLENNCSPNTQAIETPEERLLLLGYGLGDRSPPDGSEQGDSTQDVTENGRERLESGGKIAGGDIFTADKGVDLNVDEQRDWREISQETEERCVNLENLEVCNEILGEGEFGIVYKGRYGGKDGNMIDVAVKKLKGGYTRSKCPLVNS